MSKYDIKKNPQLPSDEEINKRKNFDKVLNNAAMFDYKKATKPVYKNTKVLSIVAVIAAVALIFIFETHEQEESVEKETEIKDTIKNTPAVPLIDTLVKESTREQSPSSTNIPSTNSHASTTTQVQSATHITTPNSPASIAVANDLANFPGGDEALHSFLISTIKYPYNAVETPYSGKIEVDLTIEKTGEIGNITIYHSPNAAISNEIKRVIKKMPIWKAAVKNNQAVASTVTVNFPFTYVGEY
ncbi:energy transducer TonB [uncultured Cytophaga sp.]|uniref:energy transducer TonB n=1 Tax=uncultured Cytophaga sp. TaxID=160238 RepID=UPI00260EF223|nr:energy transducer TonB [uncultured Cytophaga sp.]